MARRIVDLSNALEADIASDPPIALPEIDYVDHQSSVPQILSFFPGLEKDDLPGGEGWAVEMLRITTHNGTHMDAPYHYHSTMDGGKPAATIDEIPLDWCYRPGVKLDFRDFEDGYVASAADVEASGLRVLPTDLVLNAPVATGS